MVEHNMFNFNLFKDGGLTCVHTYFNFSFFRYIASFIHFSSYSFALSSEKRVYEIKFYVFDDDDISDEEWDELGLRDGVFQRGWERSFSSSKQEEHLNFQTLKDPFVSLEEFEQIDTIIFNSMFIII